ncbi:MAG TPA: transporter substrate-binding domain-containing protein [Pyrinomonadaceae bacterium]|nr:transporter substrate-binding domain-containing protein [Pyrinomonadaceae bacterium]
MSWNSKYRGLIVAIFFAALAFLPSCKPVEQGAARDNVTAEPPIKTVAEAPAPESPTEPEPAYDVEFLNRLRAEKWTGDLDGMVERRFIRALVLYNKTGFFYDGPQPRGINYEALKEFETFLNQRLNTGGKKVPIVFIPVSRTEGAARMGDGRADLMVNMPIIPELQARVDFSDPVRENVSELVVTGPSAPQIASLDDLAGKEIFVRKMSRYWPNLVRLNARFTAEGKPAVELKEADPNLEDEDILNMVSSGAVGITIMDDLVASLWSKVYENLNVHSDIKLVDTGKMGWAVQKGTPNFLALVNEFVSGHKVGTSFGNTIIRRYFNDTKWASNNMAPAEMEKFRAAAEHFKQYGTQYGFDWLMVAAQAYQESKIDQSVRSHVGAVGVMQIKPSTAADRSVGIQDVETSMENNIHAGVKYMDYILRTNLKDAKMDRTNRGLMAVAAYNAGPGRIASLRRRAEQEGLDPNVWFNNVEIIAAKEIGAETVNYVSNIYKYYVGFKMATEAMNVRRKAAG